MKEPAATPIASEPDDALLAAEALFDDGQLLGYYTITAFVRLYRMVKPEDRKELAMIIEGLVCNPRPLTGQAE
ncbi:MAG: hypothetical protein IJC16_00030 [Rikenellaceae bacterium]|nr:hypothetical protein [Rikenellaceae bacterium]